MRKLPFLLWLAISPLLFSEESTEKTHYKFALENDAFLNPSTDQDYTNGIQLDTTFERKSLVPIEQFLVGFLPEKKALLYSGSFGIFQNIYTPTNITTSALQLNDRPYAGWTRFAYQFNAIGSSDERSRIDSFGLSLGELGEAGAGTAQTLIHTMFRAIRPGSTTPPNPNGWSHAIGSRLAAQGFYQNSGLVFESPPSDWRFQLYQTNRYEVGNVFIRYSLGETASFGNLRGSIKTKKVVSTNQVTPPTVSTQDPVPGQSPVGMETMVLVSFPPVIGSGGIDHLEVQFRISSSMAEEIKKLKEKKRLSIDLATFIANLNVQTKFLVADPSELKEGDITETLARKIFDGLGAGDVASFKGFRVKANGGEGSIGMDAGERVLSNLYGSNIGQISSPASGSKASSTTELLQGIQDILDGKGAKPLLLNPPPLVQGTKGPDPEMALIPTGGRTFKYVPKASLTAAELQVLNAAAEKNTSAKDGGPAQSAFDVDYLDLPNVGVNFFVSGKVFFSAYNGTLDPQNSDAFLTTNAPIYPEMALGVDVKLWFLQCTYTLAARVSDLVKNYDYFDSGQTLIHNWGRFEISATF